MPLNGLSNLLTHGMAVCLKSQQDCSTYTVAQFKVDIQTYTGVSSIAINVIAWQCGSIIVTFTSQSGAQSLSLRNCCPKDVAWSSITVIKD